MSIEQKINYQLNKVPFLKKGIKRIYQRSMYMVSPKIKYEGDIHRISPNDNNEYFFGYYDKSPWDIYDRYVLCLKAKDTWSDVSPKDKADILLIDTSKDVNDENRVKVIAQTSSWNVQQSCMLQWLGPDFNRKILYNDFRDGEYCSIILDIYTKEEKIINMPVYTVSSDGKTALTLDFSRLYNLRPGYGYRNKKEVTEGQKLPDATCIWKISLETNQIEPLLKYTDFASFQSRKEMLEKNSVHKVNHLMLSPNGKRFMVLYRWFNGQRKYTRLITCNVDGTDMYVLSDDDMVSHCYWKNDEEILAFENKKTGGPGYYLMKDQTDEYKHCWPQFSNDGHPSYSPDKSLIVTDSYPDRARIASINIMDGDESKTENTTVAKVFAPFKYDNDTRCDLHPRWNHKGDKVCFDSVFEGHRGLYCVDIKRIKTATTEAEVEKKTENKNPKYTVITPMYNSFNLMHKYFESLNSQTYKNFEVIIIDDCSTDGSYEKVIEYTKKSPLTISIYQSEKNMGPGNARNIGIKVAKGEWITFVDNDDWVENNLLEEIDKVISNNQVNCVIYDYYITDSKNEKISYSMYEKEEGNISLAKCMSSVRNHTIGKFYKLANCKENNIYFPLLKRCEDVAFVCRAIDACGSVYYLNKPMYYYYQRPTSLSNNKKLDETDMIKAFDILEKALSSKYPEEIKEKSVSDLLYGVLLIMCKSGKSNLEIKKYIKEYEKNYPDWYKCQMVNKLGNAKKIFLIAAKYKQITLMKILAVIHSKLIG